MEHRSVSSANRLRDVHELNLPDEGFVVAHVCWCIVCVSSDVTTADVSRSEATDVESDVVAWLGLGDIGVVHLDTLDFSRLLTWVEDNGLSSV